MTPTGDDARRASSGRATDRRRAPLGRAPGVDLLALGVALAALAAVAAAVGSPLGRTRDPVDPPVRVLLVDTSASVTRARPGWRRWVVQEVARAARGASSEAMDVALVTFDATVQRRFGPAGADEFLERVRAGAGADWFDPTPGRDLASDLGGAARAALQVLASGDRPPGEIVVLGDGCATGEDPSKLLLDPSVERLRLVRPRAPSLTDFALVGAHAPDEVEPGAAIPVRVDAVLDGPDPRPSEAGELVLEWELRVNSADAAAASTTLRGVESFTVPPEARLARGAPAGGGLRSTRLAFDLPPLASGTATLTVRGRLGAALDTGGADPFPENDEATTSFTVGDPVRALVVVGAHGPAPEEIRFAGLAFDGIVFEVGAPTDVARALAGPQPPDAIVTFDVPLAGLPAPELAAFVRSGGGWVHCGGWSFLRADAPELGDLVALEPDREPREPRDIVFFVDGSGSMRGGRWERVRQALGELVPTAAPNDRLELRFFTQVMGESQLVLEVPGGGSFEAGESGRRQAAVRSLLAARVPGGATDIVGSLVELATVRERTREANDERSGLCVLLTDGITNSVAGLRGSVRDRLAACGDRMVVIQVGDDVQGARFLRGFLRDGETLVQAGELEDLLDILQETVQDVRVIEDSSVVAPASNPTDPWTAGVLEGVLEGADLAVPLPVQRALRCRAAEGATPILELGALEVDGQRPALAAIAPRGHGTVCGVAVPSLGRGSDAWTPSLRRRSAWLAPVLRGMARRRDAAPGDGRPPAPTAFLEQGGRALVVRGLPLELPAFLDAELATGPTVDPFGVLVPAVPFATLRLAPPTWDVSPRSVRAAERPLELDDVPRGTSLEVDLGGAIGPLAFIADGPAEVRPGVATARVFEVAGAGQFCLESGRPDAAGRRPHPLTPWLLGGALLTLFAGALGGLRRRPPTP